MIVRVRSRDGLERVTLPDTVPSTVAALRSQIESQLGVPVPSQHLSLDHNLLLSKSPADLYCFSDLSDASASLSSLGITHGSLVFLHYAGERHVAGPHRGLSSSPMKMTIEDLIARQVRVTRQETPHCESASFDRDAAYAFQLYANETLAFAVKRGGIMYGRVDDATKAVSVDFIYEPPQQGTEDELLLLRDSDEEVVVEAIAAGLGMRRVGFIFTQAVGRAAAGEYTISAAEVIQAADLQAEGGIQEWVTAMVKLEVNEEGVGNVHFEAFQLSDTCLKLFKDRWFVADGVMKNPKVSMMNKDVVVGGKDTKEVDNDFFLIPVPIYDHQGALLSGFPIENRMTTITMRALKDHMNKAKNLPFVKRISDFHILLFLARHLDMKSDIANLAECVQRQAQVSEGYQLLIESFAASC